MAQLRVPHRQPGDPGAAFRVRDIGDQAVLVDLFEGERDRDDAAVELGHGHLTGHVERAQAVVVFAPLGARAGQAQPLQDRNIQRGKVFDVPAVVIAARGRGGRFEPPAARTVTTIASAALSRCSSSGSAVRSDAQ